MKHIQAVSAAACKALPRTTTSTTVPVLTRRIAACSPLGAPQATRLRVAASSEICRARPFSQTSQLSKKKASASPPAARATANSSSKDASTTSSSSSSSSSADPNRPVPDPTTPLELADLIYGFDKADKQHGEALKTLRSGARFNPDTIGAIPVIPDRKSAEAFPLRELATVAPLGGRRWSILAFEASSIKPIMSAIQNSDAFNQQPQRSEENELELVITVEPERADALAKRVKDVCQAWRNAIRAESHKRDTLAKKWRTDGVILADDLRKVKDKVQKAQDDRMKVIAQLEKEALHQIAARAG
ncbi:ribosome recycling factor-domain-containing protein [Cercophora scortea]|uniref:Ribosome recycling factor-domain-containing protein n=1 Tax=Cercophora scortea TaxID=314031 RepID=A0AAE0MLI5_9PEZI|nr:ribosome recycling factor-domain-containing protein [Cercophora scortea]